MDNIIMDSISMDSISMDSVMHPALPVDPRRDAREGAVAGGRRPAAARRAEAPRVVSAGNLREAQARLCRHAHPVGLRAVVCGDGLLELRRALDVGGVTTISLCTSTGHVHSNAIVLYPIMRLCYTTTMQAWRNKGSS